MTFMPCACSGDTYCAVPTTMPVRVSGTAAAAFAMPKSVIFTCPFCVIMRLPGFMSRCTRPMRWITARPCAACSSTSSARFSSSAPSRAMRSASDSPRMYSMTMKHICAPLGDSSSR